MVERSGWELPMTPVKMGEGSRHLSGGIAAGRVDHQREYLRAGTVSRVDVPVMP